jgi:DNA polymerase-3 subunit gamma/tau
MAYQVLARKWRPQRFEDVVGQGGVTRTLQNAIRTGRLAQAYVFAGPRGVGKTTSARILARGLNCMAGPGPTPEPCGTCDACVEIAEGRDMDVLEIDAATHTKVETVREVIISGLSVPPVRDRYKIFIIDEVHQLSGHSFNALLKSIEEPPPHALFMMATTELQKIPETILSRSQVHEFRTIPESAIAAQLAKIAGAEGLSVADEALALIARAADGSMRDGLTAFDQVLAFAGTAVSVDDVSSVLGLVGRDLLLDILEAVADERGAAAFDLAARAVEGGYDLRLLCRELSRLVRDLMVVSVDRSRLADTALIPAGERARIEALASRFSREDLLRAFDLIAKTESDLRLAEEPRYHLEMALLKWMHLRKLAPIGELVEQLRGAPSAPRANVPAGGGGGRAGASPAAVPPVRTAASPRMAAAAAARRPSPPAPPPLRSAAAPAPPSEPEPPAYDDVDAEPPEEIPAPSGGIGLKDALLAELRRAKAGFYNMTVAQASAIQVEGDAVVFSFSEGQRLLQQNVEQARGWLEPMASTIAGRKMRATAVLRNAPSGDQGRGAGLRPRPDLEAAASADPEMKAVLDMLPLEIKSVEKLGKDGK